MYRILVSLIVMLGSVSLYIFLRMLKQYHVSVRVQNFIMFVPTALVFGVIAYSKGIDVWVGWQMVAIMIPLYCLFSWLPNLSSLLSLETAPNPGYSLMISKSYVVITAIIATIMFNSVLTRTDILAIGLVIGFSGLILIDPSKTEKSNTMKSRVWYAIYACIGRAGLALSSKRLSHQGILPDVINFRTFLVVSCCILVESAIHKQSLRVPRKAWASAAGVVMSMVVFNRAIQKGYQIAPNPGYINAANASSIALLTLLSTLIFRDPLSARKLVGIFGVVIGIVLLFVF